MAELVWMTSWEIQCCGDPFATGDGITWTVTREVDRDFLGDAIGIDLAARLTAAEEHHLTSDEMIEISGRVEATDSISCRFAARDDSIQGIVVLHPVPGTAVITRLARADGSESEDRDSGLHVLGYCVQLS